MREGSQRRLQFSSVMGLYLIYHTKIKIVLFTRVYIEEQTFINQTKNLDPDLI